MDQLLCEINQCIERKFEKIKKDGDVGIERLFVDMRWTEPNLAAYVKKQMKQLQKKQAIHQYEGIELIEEFVDRFISNE